MTTKDEGAAAWAAWREAVAAAQADCENTVARAWAQYLEALLAEEDSS
jgi:hypothetical protein